MNCSTFSSYNTNRKRSKPQSTWDSIKSTTSWWFSDDMNVKYFPCDPRILLASWASWMMCAPPCTQWVRGPTRPCCRSSESRSTPTNTSTAGTRASSSTTMLARSAWTHSLKVWSNYSLTLATGTVKFLTEFRRMFYTYRCLYALFY